VARYFINGLNASHDSASCLQRCQNMKRRLRAVSREKNRNYQVSKVDEIRVIVWGQKFSVVDAFILS